MNNQVYNPYLPQREYIPDGEPHVFGDRIYIFGSHDKERGDSYCMLDYVVWSAPVNDLSDWSNTGITYKAIQDPLFKEKECCDMYAPDVVMGNDGNYYLYYCMAGYRGSNGYCNPISVAKSNKPDGKYEYLGIVKNPDGTSFMKYVNFDPAVINDNGIIRLYSGTWYPFDIYRNENNNSEITEKEVKIFGKSKDHIENLLNNNDSIFGPFHMILDDDMLTIKSPVKRILPFNQDDPKLNGHGFFEASSIRKINNKYYFIYSSLLNHELCYAISNYPDKDFEFKGTIVSNGDIGLNGNNIKLNLTGNTHGSIEKINGQWYVFYHKNTHASDFSRQGCAEKIYFDINGQIPQVEITSCGLNNGYLKGKGKYPATICCNLTNERMPDTEINENAIPVITSDDNDIYIQLIDDSYAVYKYFNCNNLNIIKITCRGYGKLIISDKISNIELSNIEIHSDNWDSYTTILNNSFSGKTSLVFYFKGSNCNILDFTLE